VNTDQRTYVLVLWIAGFALLTTNHQKHLKTNNNYHILSHSINFVTIQCISKCIPIDKDTSVSPRYCD